MNHLSQAFPSYGATETSSASPAHDTSMSPAAREELVRIFNTALIATQAEPGRDFTKEIYDLMETPAFRAILSSVKQFSRTHNVSERQAAEQIIGVFRSLDRVWRDYVFQEGVDRLKSAT
jgi:hypothetical protein